MNRITLASGVIKTFDHEYALAGVPVIAYLPAGFPNLPGAALSEPLQIGRAETAADGSFEIVMGDDSPGAPYACYLEHCDAPGISLRCQDVDGRLLMETDVTPLQRMQGVTFSLQQTDWLPSSEDWQSVATLMQQGQVMTLDRLAEELTTSGPVGIFKGVAVSRRIGYLYDLEQALLDSDGMLLQLGITVRMAQVQNVETRVALRQQVANLDNPDFLKAFDKAVLRANLVGGDLQAADLVLNPAGFEQGDARAGVGRFLGNDGISIHHDLRPEIFDRFPALRTPLTGYRDYLVDIWVKRATKQVAEGNPLDPNGAIKQLINRFHQDFTTTDTADKPANRVLIPIMLHILQAPVGVEFGFGVAAAAILPQDELTDRQYLDYLISLTGEKRHELENRYRLNLSRSDLETSNRVQQNIETLQRFFTDSFQVPYDPWAIMPPVAGNGLPIINEYTYGRQPHGPLFWEYEEWLERNEPFYGENYYDIRRTYKVTLPKEEERKKYWGGTIPLGQFITLPYGSQDLEKFTPPVDGSPTTYAKRVDIGNQWARILGELEDLLNDAHKDFHAGFFSEAERKYVALFSLLGELQSRIGKWKGTSFDKYSPAALAKEQRNFAVKDPDALDGFENKYHLFLGYSFSGENWVRTDASYLSAVEHIPYVIEMLLTRMLPTCLSETRLALGKYREVIQGGTQPIKTTYYGGSTSYEFENSLANIARFNVFTGPTPVEPGAKVTPPEDVWWVPATKPNTGSLPFATETTDSAQEKARDSTVLFPANAMEKAYFRLKLGDALLEWADQLYRSDRPDSIQRARELYKGVLFLHGEDPDIAPAWGEWQFWKLKPFGVGKLTQNPRLTAQVNRAHIGFEQINAGVNFYGFPKDYVPPVRYRVLREAALSFSASAKSTQTDYLTYMTKYEQAVLDEMTARSIVEKANYAIQIADEQVQLAQFAVGEAQKQVEGVKGQIAAKEKEIKDSESFFSQLGDFVSGMKDAAEGLGKSAWSAMEQDPSEGEAAGGKVDWGAMYKVMSSKGSTSASAAGLSGGLAIMAGYGAFVYAGVSSMKSMEAAANKRIGELKQLREVALPAAEKMVELKKREVKISELHRSIAKADYDLGKGMLAFYDYRFLSKAFWQQMAGFTNRLMRRYLDLGGRTAWFAERALSFETDKDVRVVSFDYFPKNLRGVTGADTLQLHLSELEASRIYSLSQTIPVKQTFSMARDFPIAFGQLKKHGSCWFATAETEFRLAYPGVYGYRIRCVSIGATYANDAFPHKGMLSNHGISMVSRSDGSSHRLLRYPDALPLSEFNMRGDMLVYDLPDETLLPFEGSGIETAWELSLSRLGGAPSLENLTDVLLTFDMRASYSAALDTAHRAALPASWKKAVLISGKAQNPGVVRQFKKDGGVLTLTFRPAIAVGNSVENMRTVTFLALMLSGVEQSPIAASLNADGDGLLVNFDLTDGIALSNAGFLAAANGGIALPLNGLTGSSLDQPFTLTIDAGANPGMDNSKLYDVQMLIEYDAQV